jgi:glycosyltransferase involved in cell wall biosynthesis
LSSIIDLVPIRDPVKLADAICRVLNENRDAIGEELKRRAAEKFSLERMLEQTEQLYAEICPENRRAEHHEQGNQ